jgi:Fe-S cluster biogenesis protein NfuA
MAEAVGVSLKTEQRRRHTAVAGFGPWVRRAEGCRGTRQIEPSGQVPVNPRRPPSLRLVCEAFPDPSPFSVLRETPMAFSCDNFKQLKCYKISKHLLELQPGRVVVEQDIIEFKHGGMTLMLKEKVESALNKVRPSLQADGGDVQLIDVDDQGVVKVKLTGACGGCPMSQMTLKMGIEKILKQNVPEVTRVESA